MSDSKNSKPEPKKALAEEPGKAASTAPASQAPAKSKPVASARPAAGKKPSPGGNNSNASLWLSLLSLATSIGLAVAAFFFWNQQQQFLQDRELVAKRVDSKLQEVDTTISRVKNGFDDLKSGEQKNRDELSAKFTRLKEIQQSQSGRIDTLNALIGRSTQDWTLAEVKYLLRVASERLQLQRDVNTALLALENADQRLTELSDPGLTAVRQQIASERDLLKRVPVIDREGLASRLDALLSQIASLPLSGRVHQTLRAEGEANDEQGGADAVSQPPLDWTSWQDWKKIPAVVGDALRKLVTIRENEQLVQPMLQPGSETFLRQNLRLQIEAARLALLREDPVFYRQTIDTAKAWLKRYFAQDDAAVRSSLEQLEELGSVQLRPQMPDISKSLRLLRKQQEIAARVSPNPAGKPAASAPAPAADAGQDETAGQIP